jgi:hydroxyethylthiazole kinase-like sugar kinase family protein
VPVNGRPETGDHSCRSTSNVYGKSWREERVDAVARAVEAVSVAAQNAHKEAKQDQPESFSNEWGALWAAQPDMKSSHEYHR